jgi:hypothetical protein
VVDSSIVVTRRIEGAATEVLAEVDQLLHAPIELPGGRLVIRHPFATVRSSPVRTWATSGWFVVAGAHAAKVVRVEIELAEYSSRASTLEVRPVSRNVRRWGRWRFDRYFGLAHAAADALARELGHVSVQVAA